MRKRMVGVVVCVLMLFTAMLVSTGGVQAGEVNRLTLEKVLSRALEKNIELQIATLNLDNAQLEYQKSQADNLLNQSKYAQLSAEYDLANAEKTYQQTYVKIISDTLQLYANTVLAKMNIESKGKSLTLEEKSLAEIRKQAEMGDKGSLDLLQQENRYQNAKFTLEKMKDTYQQNLRELQKAIGLEGELELTPVATPTVWEITEDEAIRQALENSTDLVLQGKKLELAQVNQERMDVVSTSNLDQQLIANKTEIARLQVAKGREDLISSIQKKYYEFKQASTKLNLESENLTESEENYRISKEQKAVGLKTEKDLLQAEISVLDQQSQYQSALVDYYVKQLSLKQGMELEIEVLINDLTTKK